MAAGRTEEAERIARTVTRGMPGLSAGWETLGFILHTTGRLPEAAACYERLARLEPVSVSPRLNLALIALARRDLRTARTRLEEAARLSPDGIDVHLTRARLFASEGRIQQAKEEYGWVLGKDPSNRSAQAELARLQGR
jgi:Flp pilus assembly protein TadD